MFLTIDRELQVTNEGINLVTDIRTLKEDKHFVSFFECRFNDKSKKSSQVLPVKHNVNTSQIQT